MTKRLTETRRGLLRYAAALAGALMLAPALEAHQVSSISLVTHLDTEEQTYVLDAAMEVVPSDDPALNDEIPPEEAAREFAEEYLNILFDEDDHAPSVEIELVDASDEDTPEALKRQQVLAKMAGRIPEGAREFMLYLDPQCPMAVVMVVIKDGQPSRRMQVVLAGEYSRPVDVAPITEGSPFEEAEADEGDTPTEAAPETGEAEADDDESGGPSAFGAGWRSVFSGDRLPPAIVVGIFLLTLAGRRVFLQVAALLVPLSAVVALRAWDVLSAPAWAATALGVLLVAIAMEAIFHRELRWWRVAIVAVAGVFGGLAISRTMPFARLFADEAGIDAGTVILYLVGVETALIVVGIATAAALLFLSRHGWYRRSVVQPLAALLAGYGLFCAVERFL
ncbi:MAG: hypothetical protein WD342_08665 [Verrucomicrobiales bacterium]